MRFPCALWAPKSFLCRSIAVAAGAVLLVGLSASPANAKKKPPPTYSVFAGYQYPSASVTSETATVVLPKVSCKKKQASNPDINADVQLNATDSENDNTNWSEVFFACETGARNKVIGYYTPFLFIDGSQQSTGSLTVHAGDTVVLTVSCGGAGSTVSLDDVTSSTSASASSSTPSSCTGGLVGQYGGSDGIPKLGNVAWSGVNINGSSLGSLSPTSSSYYVGKGDGILMVGSLTDGGTAFTNTYSK